MKSSKVCEFDIHLFLPRRRYRRIDMSKEACTKLMNPNRGFGPG